MHYYYYYYYLYTSCWCIPRVLHFKKLPCPLLHRVPCPMSVFMLLSGYVRGLCIPFISLYSNWNLLHCFLQINYKQDWELKVALKHCWEWLDVDTLMFLLKSPVALQTLLSVSLELLHKVNTFGIWSTLFHWFLELFDIFSTSDLLGSL